MCAKSTVFHIISQDAVKIKSLLPFFETNSDSNRKSIVGNQQKKIAPQEKLRAIFIYLLALFAVLSVPLVADVKVGKSWYETK